MTIAKCTKGGPGQPEIEFSLEEGNDKENFYLDFLLPEECFPVGYKGLGIFHLNLEDLFEEFLNTYWKHTYGEQTPRLIKMLREYADKIEKDLEVRNANKPKEI